MVRVVWAAIGVVAACGAAAEGGPVALDGAQWIWHPVEGNPPAGPSYLRTAFDLPADVKVKAAEAVIAVDNLYALYVNGKFVGQRGTNPNAWRLADRFDVTGLLVPGKNAVAVEAVNTAPGPAGMIMKLAVQLADGRQVTLASNPDWLCTDKEKPNWQQTGFDDRHWWQVAVTGEYGTAPWGKFAGNLASRPLRKAGAGAKAAMTWRKLSPNIRGLAEVEPAADFRWPEAVAYLGDDCSLYHPRGRTNTSHDSLGVTIFTARKSRAFPEHDLPAPIKMGRKLYLLAPARPGVKPRLLLDAGKGAIGSPSVSFDGRWIYVSMATGGEAFFHIYRLPAFGGKAERLTEGPFHDIDPAELPDGRIVFTSTRIGTFEEYHSPPSRSLFTMQPDGTEIRPLTHTFIFDNEPEVLADGRILFIRSDNFFGRGKVETLLHAIYPDGTTGLTEFGLDNAPEYGNRLRAFYCGSPAPMPDGRVAFVSSPGITVGRPGTPGGAWQHFRLQAGDVAAMPDGRLLCTVMRRIAREGTVKNQKRTVYDVNYGKIAVLDPRTQELVVVHDSPEAALHSPVHLGPRRRPPVLADRIDIDKTDDVGATGFLYCQNARFTQHTTAGWSHVRAIRVLAGKGLTVRSSHAYIVHAGNETVELGTVPLAPDGSFYVEVPADTAIAFQAVDAEGRSELNEMSWIFARPGERRGCLGCHHTRQDAPPMGAEAALATAIPALKLLGRGRPHRFRGNNAAVTGLMEVQADRFREVAGINRHSDSADPLATGPQEVAALIAELRGEDEGLRISAAQRLAIFRDRAAGPALAERLTDGSREVRTAAALAIAACGTRRSIPPLLAALTDEDPLVAQAAAVAVENVTGRAEPFNSFAERAERAAQAKRWRAWFESTSWEAIEQDLVGRLASGDQDVVRRAAVALGHVGGAAARSALRAYVAREAKNNPYPEWRKRHRGDGARFNSSSPANPRTLQEAVRALGYLKDAGSIGILAEAIACNSDPGSANLFLTEAAIEALGRIATPAAEAALVKALAGLKDYFYYVGWYGDHSALYACHASPPHYFIAEALDAMGSKAAGPVAAHLIRSVPTDPDRALLPGNDDCETLVGRVLLRSGAGPAVTETCLALLGDPAAKPDKEIAAAIAKTYKAWAGKPDPENRAAHILSLVCRDRKYEPRIRAALDRYRARPPEKLVRAFGGGGLPSRTPVKHWVCFFLARELGNLGDPKSVRSLIAVLEQSPTEAAGGRPDPTDPAVLFLHNGLTPCYRAAAAWALGRIGDRRATPTLLKVIGDLDNATDTRHAAAEALQRLAAMADLEAIRKLAADYPEVSTRKALLRVCASLTR